MIVTMFTFKYKIRWPINRYTTMIYMEDPQIVNIPLTHVITTNIKIREIS